MQVYRKVKAELSKDDTTDEEIEAKATKIGKAINLAELDAIIDLTSEPLRRVAGESGRLALKILGEGDNEKLFNQVSETAVSYAKDRSAELIGKKIVDGELVDNPNALWSIPEATRNEIRGIIEEALKGHIELGDLSEAISTAGAFSPNRAEMIARTEIANAHSMGSLNGYRAARDAGVDVEKGWLPDDKACDVCLANAAASPIPLDQEFPSGDLAPTAHPWCECAIYAVVPDAKSAG